MAELSIRDLRSNFAGTPPGFALELLELKLSGGGYTDFVALLHKIIEYSISEMVREKNILKGMTEDQLTTFLLKPLKNSSLIANHDSNNGGHCDIVVDGWALMRWLGEAKIFTSYSKLWGGFCQLRDRYSTGVPDQNHGGMIIYYHGTNAISMLGEWKAYLKDNLTIEINEGKPLQFDTSLIHQGTGLPLVTKHIAVVLRHEPTDTQAAPTRRGAKSKAS